ncbi:MAG TPA: cupin domain-containing protein [Jatrophihabitantaceae bacterium]|nr:cupin domain-containing protein [Jatrophihabitantaceae bacterium]
MHAAEIARLLELEPLPEEGGLFRRTCADEHANAIYFLLAGDDFSALHVLTSTEVYHFYDGAPLRLLLLYPDGRVEQPVLGRDLAAGERPQLTVPPGVWQGSASAGEWTLVGTTVSPPFEWDGFRLGTRAELTDAYPSAAARIVELTRV